MNTPSRNPIVLFLDSAARLGVVVNQAALVRASGCAQSQVSPWSREPEVDGARPPDAKNAVKLFAGAKAIAKKHELPAKVVSLLNPKVWDAFRKARDAASDKQLVGS